MSADYYDYPLNPLPIERRVIAADADLATNEMPVDSAGLAQKAAEFTRYNAWRYAANAEWLGGIAAGISAEAADLPTPAQWGVAALVGVSVTKLENIQSDYAARKMAESYQSKGMKPVIDQSRKKDLLALGLSTYQGSGASVEVNDSIGLENTTLRRRVQAAAYGLAVAGWASPLATEAGKEAFEQAANHPVRFGAVALAGSVVGKFSLDRIKSIRKRAGLQTEA